MTPLETELAEMLEELLDDVCYLEFEPGVCECGDGASTDCVHQRARNLLYRIQKEKKANR